LTINTTQTWSNFPIEWCIITKEITKEYCKVKDNPKMGEVWQTGMGNEFERMVKDDNKIYDEIDCIPEDRVVTNARIVVDFRP
jgi:hypothetical protein